MLLSRIVAALFLACTFAAAEEINSPSREEKPNVDHAVYFADLKDELRKTWPKNRTVRFVFHGHSVPAGYFRTPIVRRFDSYPTLFHQAVCVEFPHAVIDVSVTAIGGENSQRGSLRFSEDVLSLKPDVVFIDYALNDRSIGLEKAAAHWRKMIQRCIDAKVLVALLTPTADENESILDGNTPLTKHAEQIRELAAEFRIPLVDSYEAFRKQVDAGTAVSELLSQRNHPNRAGHQIVADLLTQLLK